MRWNAALATLAVTLCATPAVAQSMDPIGGPAVQAEDDDSFDEPLATVAAEREWYGWQTLAADGIAGSIVGVGALADSPQTMIYGYFSFALGGPIIHFVHDRVGIGLGSLPIRLGAPPLLMLVTGSAGDYCDDSLAHCSADAVAGFVLGAAIASTIDATLFAFDAPPERRVGFEPRLAPTLQLRRDGLVVGVSATSF